MREGVLTLSRILFGECRELEFRSRLC
jgi:hypothetical protein